ncbi:hypothetical protein CEXT_99411 [Caerostris extrusa]|uniref:Uncharacterized protein n=1 Tax=Caerostris extrusa TaxID=172846 RepID=A0AAV4XH32_CAEEX|nr:hypothetical protein CEXT_99411 [Caerostris extrusa]
MISLIQGRDKAKLGRGAGKCPFEKLPINEMAEKKEGVLYEADFYEIDFSSEVELATSKELAPQLGLSQVIAKPSPHKHKPSRHPSIQTLSARSSVEEHITYCCAEERIRRRNGRGGMKKTEEEFQKYCIRDIPPSF